MRDLFVITSEHCVENMELEHFEKVADVLEVRLDVIKGITIHSSGVTWSYFADGMSRKSADSSRVFLRCAAILSTSSLEEMALEFKENKDYGAYEDMKKISLFKFLEENSVSIIPRYTENKYTRDLTYLALGCENGYFRSQFPADQEADKARGILSMCDKALGRKNSFQKLPLTFESAFTALTYVRDCTVVKTLVRSTSADSRNNLLFMGRAHPLTCLVDGTFSGSFCYVPRADIDVIDNEIVVSGNLPSRMKHYFDQKESWYTNSGKRVRVDLKYDLQ